jgi:hypothetical protein
MFVKSEILVVLPIINHLSLGNPFKIDQLPIPDAKYTFVAEMARKAVANTVVA